PCCSFRSQPHRAPPALHSFPTRRSSDLAEGDLMADLNPNSLEMLQGAVVEPALAGDNSEAPVQFERQGYFCRDPESAPGRLVFNRTIGLRDSWTRAQAGR